MMHPKLTEQDLARQKAKALEKEKQYELALQKEMRAVFQKDLEHNSMVLNNLFELILRNHPKVAAKFNIRAGNGTEEQDRLKMQVIQAAAMQLTNNHGPLKENELNDPQCLDNLVVSLVKTMVVNYTLNNHPELNDLMNQHQRNLSTFADSLPSKTGDFQEEMALSTLKDGLKNNAPQHELNEALDNLKDETLKNLKGPLNKLFEETDKLTKTVMDKLSESIQKEVNSQVQKNFPQLKPSPPGSGTKKSADNSNNETAELRDNPFANLTGLSSNLAGCVPITICSNIGNGLGLITSLRASTSTSRENVDAGHTKQSQLGGQVEGFAGEEEGIDQFTKFSADSFSR